ncbi:hypothetical protein SKAU_G00025900 [Synaphobranchus kaupii]|uniref:Uncharacterized protein n=1 Tax=Synaphobranchus kaupii TaxID=118154 RepID=A0A9Q1GEM0_SYNKA|nr:hypothetical protein SKAU_G00025900 [Synaphobranchus kaupii]
MAFVSTGLVRLVQASIPNTGGSSDLISPCFRRGPRSPRLMYGGWRVLQRQAGSSERDGPAPSRLPQSAQLTNVPRAGGEGSYPDSRPWLGVTFRPQAPKDIDPSSCTPPSFGTAPELRWVLCAGYTACDVTVCDDLPVRHTVKHMHARAHAGTLAYTGTLTQAVQASST